MGWQRDFNCGRPAHQDDTRAPCTTRHGDEGLEDEETVPTNSCILFDAVN
jgi:hypothetical protein